MAVQTADAVVVGGGVMGASILYHLAARGVTNTVLLEKDALVSGATGRSQAILRMHYSNEVTARLAWKSLDVFRNFHEITGVPSGYVRTGYLLIVGDADRDALHRNVSMLKRVGVETEVVSPERAMEMASGMVVREDETLAHEPESGYADPYSVTTGFARRARDMGARVRENAPVTAVETRGDRVCAVVTADGRIETPTVVVATGPWTGPFLARLGFEAPLDTVRHQVVRFRRPARQVPDYPIVGDVVNGLSARPDVGNTTTVGVGEQERVGPEKFNQGVDMPVVEKTMADLALRFPEMPGAEFMGGWSGLFTVTPDWHPILGRVEGIEGLYCAVGFSGHGFKLSPMVGIVMAELITQGEATTVDISMLGLDRFEKRRPLGSSYRMKVLA